MYLRPLERESQKMKLIRKLIRLKKEQANRKKKKKVRGSITRVC